MKSPAFAVITEHYNATHYINFVAPFEADKGLRLLTRSADEVESLDGDALTAALPLVYQGEKVRAAILSRYAGSKALHIVDCYKNQGIPVCFHLDDWMFELPADLGPPYTERYGDAYRRSLEAIIASADLVLCSTPALAEKMIQRFPDRPVRELLGVCFAAFPGVHPAFKARLSRAKRRWQRRAEVVIGYAGSSSHVRDLQMVVPALERIMRAHPQVRFETFGIPLPSSLKNHWPERTASYGYTRDYPAYMQTLYELGWDVGLCPLIDDSFNRCKTATKLVEYCASGIPALCSDVEPYRRALPGSDALVRQGDWYQAIHAWVLNKTQRRATLNQATTTLKTASPRVALQRFVQAVDGMNPTD